MKPLFIKKNGTVSKVSGIIMNLIPSYTMAEYNALTHKPLLWVRTDEDYAQIPSEDVSYGSGSVKDALDDLNEVVENRKVSISNFSATTNGVGAFTVGDATTQVCVAIIFPLGNEYTYYQYDKTNFILFNMSGVKQTNVSISGRAVLLSLK